MKRASCTCNPVLPGGRHWESCELEQARRRAAYDDYMRRREAGKRAKETRQERAIARQLRRAAKEG